MSEWKWYTRPVPIITLVVVGWAIIRGALYVGDNIHLAPGADWKRLCIALVYVALNLAWVGLYAWALHHRYKGRPRG